MERELCWECDLYQCLGNCAINGKTRYAVCIFIHLDPFRLFCSTIHRKTFHFVSNRRPRVFLCFVLLHFHPFEDPSKTFMPLGFIIFLSICHRPLSPE